MAKTKRKIIEDLKLIDIVLEMIDARIPLSSRNPDLDKIIRLKPKLILMNKCDMSESNQNNRWIDYFKNKNILAIPVDCKSGKGLRLLFPSIEKILKEKISYLQSRGKHSKNIRIMIVGIPNVGKSSFINTMAKNSKIKIEDRPGVTRGNQWFSINKDIECLDTPGILWPKFDDPLVGENLAFVGSIKDQILNIEHLAIKVIEILKFRNLFEFKNRFKISNLDISQMSGLEILNLVGKKRGMLVSGGKTDIQRTSIMILDEFRSAKFGKITLERI